MAKYTSKLELIGILQFGQKHLRLEINFSKEIEKMIAKTFIKLLCAYLNAFFLLQLHLNLCAITI